MEFGSGFFEKTGQFMKSFGKAGQVISTAQMLNRINDSGTFENETKKFFKDKSEDFARRIAKKSQENVVKSINEPLSIELAINNIGNAISKSISPQTVAYVGAGTAIIGTIVYGIANAPYTFSLGMASLAGVDISRTNINSFQTVNINDANAKYSFGTPM
jgi:hypothetical protein